jgi:hypothetical protein
MSTESKFKEGDSVFHIQYGWGTIKTDKYTIYVEFNDKRLDNMYISENNILSFTEYTLEGFSQDRPEVQPKEGQIVWVRDSEYRDWQISHFVNMNTSLNHKYFCSHTNNDENIEGFIYLTTENPYETAED